MKADIDKSVQFVKGVGPRRAGLLRRLGIQTVEELLYYFPRDYQDRRFFHSISSLREGEVATIRGKVLASGIIETRRRKKIFRLVVGDETGKIPCTWFNQPYLKENFHRGEEIVFSGKVQKYRVLQMINPEYEKSGEKKESLIHAGRIVPFYPLTEGLNQKALRRVIRRALEEYLPHLPDMLPEELRQRWKVTTFQRAMNDIHYPPDYASLREARKRLILDEFFLLQLGLAVKRARQALEERALPHRTDSLLLETFIKSLPFRLTRAQGRAIWEIKKDMKGPRPMNRLLQGDVGSGKTLVAVGGLVFTVDNGYQGAIMVPTEILAQQHYQNLQEMLAPLKIKVALFTGGVKSAEREELLKEIKNGKSQLVVGTQALIQERVIFKKLGMVVADEQHKFGVLERARLREKGYSPHVLVMTATPIPRTLTLTVYGDLDISILDELPPGRKKVRTYWIGPAKLTRAYDFIREEVRKKRQAFIIYPLIEESESLQVKAAAEMFQHLQKWVFSGIRLGLVHGRMPTAEKEKIMNEFRARRIDILVSTVVVEIGIDIPDATVMLVENAERFGLAQLHQLRGRVGRSRYQSHCILQGNPRTEQGVKRLQAMKNIDDGFVIAQEDLEIRGPGEFFGTRQHGLPEIRIGRILADVNLMEFARRQAFRLIEKDPHLSDPKYSLIREKLRAKYQGKFELGQVG